MKTDKKKRGIIHEYRRCWDYLKDSKKFIYFVAGIFLLFVLIGFFIPVPELVYEKIMTYIRELLKQTEGLSLFQLLWFILSNNLKSTLFGIILGSLFGIYPLISTISNGYLLGFVSSVSVSVAGMTSLWRLFPHGIFEIPAIFISLGLGIKLGFWLFLEPVKYYIKKNKLIACSLILFYVPTLLCTLIVNRQFRNLMKKHLKVFWDNLGKSVLTFFLVITPLLIVAGIIESVIFFFVK